MSVPSIKTSFASGEISPSLFGHVDFAKISTGASTMRNSIVSYRGGAYSRAGTAFVEYSKQTGRGYPPRLITFQFSIKQGLALEFGNFYMRVILNGQYVTETAQSITAISNANPGVFSITNSWAVGDWIYLNNIAGLPSINGNTYIITSRTSSSITLQDVFGNVINTTLLGTYTGGGTGARIYTLTTPYAEADLEYLKFTESADVMSFCCWNQQTGTSYPAYDLTRLNDTNWTLTKVNPTPTISAPASCNGSSSSGGATDYNYRVTAISKVDGSESVGSPIADIANAVNIAATAGTNTITWSPVTAASSYNIYKTLQSTNGTVPPGSTFGYAGQSTGTQFLDTNITADFSKTPPNYVNPFAPGQITSVLITGGGSGLATVTWAVTSATGSGFNGYPVVVNGQLTAFVITNTGINYAPGDSIAFNSAGFAAGAINFSTNPSNGDTITLNGIVWTFVLSGSGTNQTLIQGTLALTLSQLASDLSASVNMSLTVAAYRSTNTALVINYSIAGTVGNSYTLAASNATPSGPTLTGGSGSAGTAPSATLIVGPTSGTYPSVVAYFQERRIYGASPNNPDTYWLSQPGAYLNYDTRNPSISSDSITGSPWSVQVNGIQYMVPMPGGLVVLTGLSAWQLTGTGGSSLNPQPITPSTQQAQPQAYNGCSPTIPPFKSDYNIIYVQAKGSIVRNIEYNFFTNIYTGTDMTQLSSHLFLGYTLREWAWCEEPYKIAWAVRNDGALLSLTYLKPQEIMGWSRNDTQGTFKSVCSVTEPPVDALYACVQRYINGNPSYMIERMNDRLWTNIEDCWCVDAAISLSQPKPNASITSSSASGLGSITGVSNLIGGNNYSSSTFATVVDDNGNGAGTGAIPTLTIVSGVITNISFLTGNQGTGYSYPKIIISDPTSQGSGASATAILDNSATFTTTSSVFNSSMAIAPGYVIRMGGGIAKITSYISPTQVIANIISPIVQTIPNTNDIPMIQTSGNWTLTQPVSKVYGLNHLIGAQVTGLADGQVIPPTTVAADGSIVLSSPASSIIVGLGFTTQVQSTYLDAGQPTVQGQRKKIAAATIRLETSCAAQVGCNQVDGSTLSPIQLAPKWVNMVNMPPVGTSAYNDPSLPLYTGDVRIPIPGGFNRPGQIAIQQTQPVPLNILAIIPETDFGDLPQPPGPVQAPKQNQSRR